MEDVDLLSDEDDGGPQELCAADQPPPVRFKRLSSLEACDLSEISKKLRGVVSSNCKCKQGACRAHWREPANFERILQVRLKLHSMHKLQADREALVLNVVFVSDFFLLDPSLQD